MSRNYSLFSTQSTVAGFRLHRMEILNWGTFHNEIWQISPQGNTTLLTGKNGSGKTTYIEALLTLLVPEGRKRTYNSASGQKGERSEESYVLGDYGTAENDDGKFTERHRKDKSTTYSVILAVFKNEERYFTLFQVRWFVNNEMRRNYLIAYKDLTIEKDIIPFDASGYWKKNLKKKYPKIGNKEIIVEYDGPTKYAEGIRKVFGMKEKALTLFSQMVGLKVLGNLDEFIRTNMLEESKTESDFQNLRTNYQKLLDAHKNIEKAKFQLELLKPITEIDKNIQKSNEKIDELTDLKQINPIYFATHKIEFLKTEILKKEEELRQILQKIGELKTELSEDRETEKELDFSIRNDETGKRIQEIEKDIKAKNKDKENREKKIKKYNELALKLNISENPDETIFLNQIQKLKERKTEIKTELDDKENGIQRRLRVLENEKEQLEFQYNEKQIELDELRKQKNNITGRVSEIRQEILIFTGATSVEIPFVGELIKVLPSEKDWEPAIEKTLHNFALRLIVPEKYYRKVNEYVNDNNLKGRVVYERFKNETFLNQFSQTSENSIYMKIEIKRDSEYNDWIENQLKTNYNFICTTRENLPAYQQAITKEGLIKNNARHEKDDRIQIANNQNYVLGWDNKEKIKLVKDNLIDIENLIKDKKAIINLLEKRQKSLNTEFENCTKILEFDNFTDIDIQTLVLATIELQKQKDELEKTKKKKKKLKDQLTALQSKILKNDTLKDDLLGTFTKEGSVLNYYESQLSQNKKLILEFSDFDLTDKIKLFETTFEKIIKDLDFKNLDKKQKSITETIEKDFDSQNKNKIEFEKQLSTLMLKYKRPEKEILDKFPDWTSDTHKLSEDIKYVKEDYIAIFNRLETEELAIHLNNFKKYLNEDMITQMTGFSTLLETQEENIKESIESLNEPLRKIKFQTNPQTFIKLYAIPINTGSVREFKIMLKDWKPNLSEYERTKNDTILEESFLKIKALIEKLTNNEQWRKEVTDVRNWLSFTAKEHYFEDEKRPPLNIYENIAKLSSGEQAQITYTIMGAAIAYQYGILKDGLNTNSFRFVCVDEAFAKQDEEKAFYLLDLIKKLNLQMLLVTPDDKIHVAENFISAVHIVHRMPDRTSRIFDTTIEQAKKMVEDNKTEN